MKVKYIIILGTFGFIAFGFTPKSSTCERDFIENFKDTTKPIMSDSREPEVAPPSALHDQDEEIYEIVEEMPEFPGGHEAMIKFISSNFKYPGAAKRFDIQGRVLIVFVVNTLGEISDIEPLLPPERQLGYGLEEEAMRVVALMPKWKPGYQNNKAVRVRYTLPINCALNR